MTRRVWSAALTMAVGVVLTSPSASLAEPGRSAMVVELRHACDAIVAGVRALPPLQRTPFIQVAALAGDTDQATASLRRVLTDYLAVACLHRTYGYEVAMGEGTAGSGRAADLRVTGEVSRGPTTYLVSAQIVDVASSRSVSAVMHPLPIDAADAYVDFMLRRRTPAAAALRSAALPGWGQLYNDELTKGVLFIAAESLLIGAAVGFYAAHLDAWHSYHSDVVEVVPRHDAGDRYQVLTQITLGLAAAVWVGSILDAWLEGYRYDPESSFDRQGRIGPELTPGVRLMWSGSTIGIRW